MISLPQLTLNLNADNLKELIFQLPPEDFIKLAFEIRERAETFEMMELAQSGFEEWNEPGEDIYDDKSES